MSGTTDIQKTKPRDSNIELLRIVAMLLVMIVHTNFFSTGVPSHAELVAEPIKTTFRFLVQSVAIVCVNLFILISGWYGIRARVSRFLEFVFQILFFSVILYVVFYFIKPHNWPLAKGLGSAVRILVDSWFVTSYTLLYLLSPIFNAYAERAPERQFRWLLIVFFAFQFVLGWWSGFVAWFDRGYSALSFFGLYLLARYVRLHSERLKKLRGRFDIAIWLLTVAIITALAVIGLYFTGKTDLLIYHYNSPLVIAASLFLFLAFNRLKFRNQTVNWVAASCFAAFLLHMNLPFMQEVFHPTILIAYRSYPYPMFLLTASTFVFAVFTLAVLADKTRIAVWKLILRIARHPDGKK